MSTQPSAGASSSNETATFRHGPFNHPLKFVGLTVKQAREKLGDAWSVPSDAKAMNGKQQLSDDYIIQSGDEIEFVKKQGQKG